MNTISWTDITPLPLCIYRTSQRQVHELGRKDAVTQWASALVDSDLLQEVSFVLAAEFRITQVFGRVDDQPGLSRRCRVSGVNCVVQDCSGYAVSFNKRHRGGGGWRVLSTHVRERSHGNCDPGQEVSCAEHLRCVTKTVYWCSAYSLITKRVVVVKLWRMIIDR